MSAYIVARVNVTDPEKYKNYIALSPGAIAAAGGRFIARGGDVITLEGEEETNRVVIVEFESMKKAEEFYHSELYQKAKLERQGAATGQFIIVDGL